MGMDILSERLLEKAKKGCEIKILLMHEENPSLNDLINDKLDDTTGKDYSNKMQSNWEVYSEIAEKHENIEVRQLKKGTMTHSKYINDDFGYFIVFCL